MNSTGVAHCGREQRPYGVSAPNSRSPAVARRLPRLTRSRRERNATAVSRCRFVSSARAGGRCDAVRAATSVRRAAVKRRCAAFGLPRAAGGGEGAECCTTALAGARFAGRGPRFYYAVAARGTAEGLQRAVSCQELERRGVLWRTTA
jgi:hypothetical protein